jgi:hypothetical protein
VLSRIEAKYLPSDWRLQRQDRDIAWLGQTKTARETHKRVTTKIAPERVRETAVNNCMGK